MSLTNDPKIVVQIPCFNEEATIQATVSDIQAALASLPNVVTLVIDDGSTDRTVDAARRAGVDWVARIPQNGGLARAFITGLNASVRLGADIIVNTDADNQYCADDITKLIQPIVAGRCGMVIGARPIAEIEHFPWYKKLLQRVGTATVRWLSGSQLIDATSGFRAFSREVALRLNVFTPFTYTLETIIQAGRSGITIESVPVRVNPPTRSSRLFRSIPQYILRATLSMLKVYTIYEPLRTYLILGLVPFTAALALCIRYILLITLSDPTRSHAPSLILAAVLFVLSFLLWAIGVLAELVATNRRLLEDIQNEQRRARLRSGNPLSLDDNFELSNLKRPGSAT